MDSIDDIIEGLKKFQYKLKEEDPEMAIAFSILGGEPTLVPQKVTQELTKRLNKELDLKEIILITNTFDADKVINFFHPDFPKEKIKIQSSYDGGIIHDQFRLTSAKKSSRELVSKEIRKLLGRGYKVTLKATLPPEAIGGVYNAVRDYLTFEDEINENNGYGKNFSYYPTLDTTSFLMTKLRMEVHSGNTGENSNYSKLIKDLDKTFKELIKIELDRLIRGDKVFTRWFRELSYTANKTTCSAGINLIGLDQDGNARYCHRTEYDSEKSPYSNFNKLSYGKLNSNKFFTKFSETKEELVNIKESKNLDDFSYCGNCKTLTCVRCPMINTIPNRSFDTTTSGDLYTDMYSHSINLSCELNNTISIYLYIYDKIVREFKEKI
jgi:sulfatase maturation enzyme AslB (radical SAM superfamily)